jgi:hypothetical protein
MIIDNLHKEQDSCEFMSNSKMESIIFILTKTFAWWQSFFQAEQVWQIEGITYIVYENKTHKLSFQTTKAKPHAVIQVLSIILSSSSVPISTKKL